MRHGTLLGLRRDAVLFKRLIDCMIAPAVSRISKMLRHSVLEGVTQLRSYALVNTPGKKLIVLEKNILNAILYENS
jgi:hypothetical protein